MAAGKRLRNGLLSLILFGTTAPTLLAQTHFIDLSKAANRGLAESFDDVVSGISDLKEKNGLRSLPLGLQTFRGVPFQILDPQKNQGHSFIALKGRHKPDFPEGISIPTSNLKAPFLYFFHSCRWGGTAPNITVAEYDIVYEDGQVSIIPLRVGVELTNFFGSDDTSSSFLAWWHKYKNTEMGINLFPWKNPRPDIGIQSILFKSRGSMPVPILFAITASDKELVVSTVSPKPEKTFQTDTSKWIPTELSTASPAGTAIDMSFLLDAPAGKHGKVKADGDRLVFEDGTPARFWGTELMGDWWNLSDTQLSKLAERLAESGCNLLAIDDSANTSTASRLPAIRDALKPKGIYLDLTHPGGTAVTEALNDDPSVIPQNLWSFGVIHRGATDQPSMPLEFMDQPMVLSPEESIPLHLGFSRSLGLAYRTEWENGWPNEYLGETPLLVSAYGCFEDWAACLGMGFSGEETGSPIKVDLDMLNKPVLSAQWPIAALAYLRGDLKQGKTYVLQARDEKPDLTTSLKSLAHRSGINGMDEKIKTDVSGELKAKIQPKLKSFVSDTGQITWQGNVGVVKVDAPRFQALIGFLSHRKFNNAYWAVETPNEFVSLSAISLTKKSLVDSDHLLLTDVTRMENTGMVYNLAKTKLMDAGKTPILVEPLNAKIVLYRFQKDPKLKVRALDISGHPLKTRVSTKWVKNSLAISWTPSAFYLEIFR